MNIGHNVEVIDLILSVEVICMLFNPTKLNQFAGSSL